MNTLHVRSIGYQRSWVVAFLMGVLPGLVGNGPPRVVAEEVGDAPLVSVDVDFRTFAESQFGKLLIKAGTTLAAQEMDKDPQQAEEAVLESIGFDPIAQELRFSAQVKNLEDPLKGLRVIAEFKDSTGNLEGLLLAAPEYRQSKQAGHTIHSATLDNQDVHAAFHTAESGKKRIVVASSLTTVSEALEDLQTGGAPTSEMAEGQFACVRLRTLPRELVDDTPVANIVRLIEEGSLSLGQREQDLFLELVLVAKQDEQAEQLQQLMQGLVAMVGLFKEEIREELDDERVANQLLPILDQLTVEREGVRLRMGTRIPASLVTDFLREEADLPL